MSYKLLGTGCPCCRNQFVAGQRPPVWQRGPCFGPDGTPLPGPFYCHRVRRNSNLVPSDQRELGNFIFDAVLLAGNASGQG